MKIVPQVKCRRCGESFSSLRSTCPNCGVRRTAQSTRTPNATPGNNRSTAAGARAESNMKWQMIFGLILVVAVILAVIVMVSTGLNGADAGKNHVAPTPSAPVQTEAPPEVEAAPTPPPTPTPTVQTLQICYVTTDYTNKDFTMRLSNNEELTLTAKAWPADVIDISDVKWSCDNSDVLELTDNGDGTVLVKIIGTKDTGYVTIFAEIYGVKAEVYVYCKN